MEAIMKKIFMVSVLILLLSVVVSPVFSDEMAKEGSGSGHGYYIGNLTVLPFGKTTLQMNYEAYGISVTDTGKGLFHNASQQILGGMRIVDGVITDSGFIIATLTSGDKVFMTYKASGKIGKPTAVKGTVTYVGGTGKATGITGGGEFTRAPGKNQEKKLIFIRQNSSIAAQADF